MTQESKSTSSINEQGTVTKLDALIIGAGITGLYQLHRMREMGLKARAYDAASGVGGTWYWNRYPGARLDSQSEIYQYWFSEDLYKSWQPSERFTAQQENEAWLNHVADYLDLRDDIQLNTRIVSANYNEESGRWLVVTDSGEHIDTQFFLACCGMLSAPLKDRFPGQASFRGEIHHTGLWPKEDISFEGKRVAVIGTGATGIQVIQTIASEVASLKVFTRTPQYIIPMKNFKYNSEDWEKWSSRFYELKKRVKETFAGFDSSFENPPWADLSEKERQDILEKHWADGSLSMWLATFPEMFFDEVVSEKVSDFVRDKMRARLQNDPELCEKLIPTDYGFGTHRVPLENKYLEVYLQDNVEAVDCRKSPIECIVPEGIKMANGTVYEVDIIVMAVGFDAGTGALSRIDIRGRDKRSLKEQWSEEIRTAMGLQVHGYPNLFMTAAPLAPSAALCNMTTCLQQQVDWITECIKYARDHDKNCVEVSQEFEDEWVKHHDELVSQTLLAKTNSWYMGSNIEGKPRRMLSYVGGANIYHEKCDEIATNGYQEFVMS